MTPRTEPIMTTETKPVPSLQQLEASTRQLVRERMLSKGGQMPSEKVVEMGVKALALKTHQELSQQAQR